MVKVTVTTGYSCNNRCRFCAQGSLRQQVADADDEMVRKTLRDTVKKGTVVVLSGGEVSLRPELSGWVQAARMAGASDVWLQTNGRMGAYAQWFQRLVDVGLSGVVVALHGPTAEIHDYLTDCPGSWDQTMVGIRRANAAKLEVAAATVLVRSNFRHVGDLAALLWRHGVKRWHVHGLKVVGNVGDNSAALAPRFTLLAPYVSRAATRFTGLGGRLFLYGLPLCGGSEWEKWADGSSGEHVGPLPPSVSEPKRTYAAGCAACRLRSACPGLDSLYADRYGFSELTVRS